MTEWQDPVGDLREWADRYKRATPTHARIATALVHHNLGVRYGRSAVVAQANMQAQMMGFLGARVVWTCGPVPFKQNKRRYGR